MEWGECGNLLAAPASHRYGYLALLEARSILIYSTCTYNTKENEENIRWIRDEFGAEVLPLEISTDWNITGNLLSGEDFPAYRFLPHRTKGEGFFLAVLRKPGVRDGNTWAGQVKSREKGRKPQGKGAKTPGVSKEQLSALREWLAAPDNYEFIVNGNNVSAFPKRISPNCRLCVRHSVSCRLG
mgnify:CR=1 FL=1